MADRRAIVLNPAGYQEVLQTDDHLVVDAPAQFVETNFTENITATTADFSGQITLGFDPIESLQAVTLQYLETVATDLTLTAALPVEINSNVISVNDATVDNVGVVRFASDDEVKNNEAVQAAVRPDQLLFNLDNLQLFGTEPITVTTNAANVYQVGINQATNSSDGSIRIARDDEFVLHTSETLAVNPKQVAAALAAFPYATRTTAGKIRLATPSEATAGVADNVAVSPDQLNAKIASITITADLPLEVAGNEYGDVYNFTILPATTLAQGTVRYSTAAEFDAGTSTDTVVTPAQIKSRFDSLVINDATKTVKGIVMLANHSDVVAGTDDTKAITSAGLRYALDDPNYVLDGGTYAGAPTFTSYGYQWSGNTGTIDVNGEYFSMSYSGIIRDSFDYIDLNGKDIRNDGLPADNTSGTMWYSTDDGVSWVEVSGTFYRHYQWFSTTANVPSGVNPKITFTNPSV